MSQAIPNEKIKQRELKLIPKYFLYFSTILTVVFAVYYIFGLSFYGFALMNWSYYYILIGLLLPHVFLLFPMFPIKRADADKIPLYDLIAATLAFLIPIYLSTIAFEIDDRGWSMRPSPPLLIVGSIFCLLVVESARRTGGYFFSLITLIFTLYPLFADSFPGILRGINFSYNATVGHHIYGAEGILGIPTKVIGEILIGFLLFAGLLIRTGAGEFFLKMALAAAGQHRGGAAKVAVISSGFFGSLSGSIFANIIGTGSVTIPAMKKAGFRPHFAAAVEACASTGGVLMPPVMGAVAFVMASLTDISYAQICIAAFIPSFFYYFALLVQIDSNAARRNITGLPKSETPFFADTLKQGWHFLFVLIFLIWGLLVLRWEAKTPFYAAVILIILTMIRKTTRIKSKQDVLSIIEGVGKILVESAGIIIPLGLIVSGLTITGMAPALSSGIIALSHGIPFFALLLGAISCYLLGMVGLLTPAYIFLAVTLAPSLVTVGFNLMAVHLFIMYYAMLSAITPPVAVGSFLAAGIAGSSPLKTAFQSMRLGIVIYIIPLFFVYRPTLILQGGTIPLFLFYFCTCLVGVFLLSCAIEGYMQKVGTLGNTERFLFFSGGLLIAAPNIKLTLAGVVITAISFFFSWYHKLQLKRVFKDSA